jgi:hypothetical protein
LFPDFYAGGVGGVGPEGRALEISVSPHFWHFLAIVIVLWADAMPATH